MFALERYPLMQCLYVARKALLSICLQWFPSREVFVSKSSIVQLVRPWMPYWVNTKVPGIAVLRAPAWEYWESRDSDYFGTSLIFCLKIPFGELFSKIIILSSSAFLFLKKIRTFKNASKVRFQPNEIPQITRKDEAFVNSLNSINYC